MNQNRILFRKSLLSMKAELGAILLFQFVLLIARFNDIIEIEMRPTQTDRMFEDLFTMSFYLYPALLMYSLYMDSQLGTVFQWHSLPVGKWRDMAARFLAVCSAFAASLVMTAVLHLLKHTFIPSTVKLRLPRYVYMKLLYWGCDPFFILCMVCFGWGLVQMVRVNRLLLGLSVSALLFGFYKWFAWTVSGFYAYAFNLGRTYFGVTPEMMIKQFLATVLTGLMLAVLGLFVYEKYGEV